MLYLLPPEGEDSRSAVASTDLTCPLFSDFKATSELGCFSELTSLPGSYLPGVPLRGGYGRDFGLTSGPPAEGLASSPIFQPSPPPDGAGSPSPHCQRAFEIVGFTGKAGRGSRLLI